MLVQKALPPAQGGVNGHEQASVLAQIDCRQCLLPSCAVAQTAPLPHSLQSLTDRHELDDTQSDQQPFTTLGRWWLGQLGAGMPQLAPLHSALMNVQLPPSELYWESQVRRLAA